MSKVPNSRSNKKQVICGWCNSPTEIIWVHGHGQCKICGLNIDECCRGENCQPENLPNNTLNDVSNRTNK